MTRSAGVLGMLALSACAIGPGEDAQPEVACGAPSLQPLVGESESVLQTMKFGGTVRIIRPGMAVTQDYSPARLNIEVDAQGRIARIWCG